MKISYSWLSQYVKTKKDINQIEEILTQTGLEVEGVEEVEIIKGGLKGLVVGHVVSKEKHPNADKLSVTKVDVGSGELLDIVCGAPNVAAGQKVVVATVGTTLFPLEGDSFKIKKGKIRGEVSLGMICAEDEIGLGTSHDGILVLDENAKIGTPVAELFKLENDVCIEIGLTPNRTDGMSHVGVARDLVAALHNMEGIENERDAKVNWPDVSSFEVDNTELTFNVEVENQELCPRYCGVSLTNISLAPSPDWMQKHLKTIGIKPTNNVVDITNYVLHELGQPLHAFDADKIKGNKIVVGTVKNNTKFTTLDEVERELDKEDLMIKNAEDAMCIAGVFGGLTSGVSDTTTSIFLESAYFNPVSVRKSAKRHGLNTDASFRFERGVDPNITVLALKRAAILMKEICGAKISSEIVDSYPNPIENFDVKMKWNNVSRLIGFQIPKERIRSILSDLDIEITEENEELVHLSVPPYRADVQREADVIEEVLRIYGFNNIPIPEKINASLSYSKKPNKEKTVNIVADYLASNGFYEAMSNSLTKEKYGEDLSIEQLNPNTRVKILNPLSSDLGVMRQTLLYGGLEAVLRNHNHKNFDLQLFEFGKEYRFKGDNQYQEVNKLLLLSTGNQQYENWNAKAKSVDYFDIKGQVDHIIQRLGIDINRTESPTKSNLLSGGMDIAINRKPVASIGWVNDEILAYFNIKRPVLMADINWDTVIELLAMNRTKFKPISKFPKVRRDLSLLIDESVTFDKIKEIAQKAEKKSLIEVGLFDFYQGKNLEKGKKSYAVKFIFEDQEKTMTDKQIEKMMNKIQSSLQHQLGATLR